MEEHTADAFANRDEAVPLLTVTHDDDEESMSKIESDSRQTILGKKLSTSRLKEKARNLRQAQVEKAEAVSGTGSSLQDRLFAKYVCL